MAINQANIKAVITAEDKASAVLKGFGSEVDKTSSSASDSLGKLNTSFLAVTAATAGLVAFGKKSLDAFNQQDLATTRLQAGINNVTSARSKDISSLLAQATALQKTTRFSDEAYVSAQGILTTFQLNQDAIAKLTPRLADMSEGLARVTGEMPDLEGNAILVAKAIGGEDVTGLVGALRRVGVVMTDSQQKMLQTGTVEERVSLVTKILDQNFQGLAKAAGGTTAGKMAELKNQFNELEEAVGGVIAKALTPLLNLLLQHPAILNSVTIAVGTLTTAFIALKVSAAISTTFGMTTASIAQVGVASEASAVQVGILSTALSTPMILTISITAALIAIQQVYNSYKETQAAIQKTTDAIKGDISTAQGTINNLTQSLHGTGAEAERAQKTLIGLGVPQSKINQMAGLQLGSYASGGYTGSGGDNEIAGLVHKGEYVLPQSMVDQSTGKPKASGSTINITIQAGALMGNDVEARKFAQIIMKHYQDAIGSKMMGMA